MSACAACLDCSALLLFGCSRSPCDSVTLFAVWTTTANIFSTSNLPQTFAQYVLQFYVSLLYYHLVNSNGSPARELVLVIPINKTTNPSPAAVIPHRLPDLQSMSCTINWMVVFISLKKNSDRKRNVQSGFWLPYSLLFTDHDPRKPLCVLCGQAITSNSNKPAHPACSNQSQLCHFSNPPSQFTAYRNSDGVLPCPRCKKGFVRPSELVVRVHVDFLSGIMLISISASL